MPYTCPACRRNYMYQTMCCYVECHFWQAPAPKDGQRVADWVMNYTMPGPPFDPRNPRHPYDIDYPPLTGHKRPHDMYPPRYY